MAGNMRMPTSAPSCRLDPRQHNPRTLPIRQDWAFDGGASCGGATTAADRHRLVIHDPACVGCARYLRAVRVEDGRTIPHPRRIGRAARQIVAECDEGGGALPAEPRQLEAAHGATSERREGEGA